MRTEPPVGIAQLTAMRPENLPVKACRACKYLCTQALSGNKVPDRQHLSFHTGILVLPYETRLWYADTNQSKTSAICLILAVRANS